MPDGPYSRVNALIIALFLLPLGIYLLGLGYVNRRSSPLMVSGTWDAVGLLFALSGFLIFGGPAVLTALHDRWRVLWLMGDPGAVRVSLDFYRPWWVILGCNYFVIVIAVVMWHLHRARYLTHIYNLETAIIRQELLVSCHTMNLVPKVIGDQYRFEVGARSENLQLEAFESFSHVTLCWSHPNSPVRLALERNLAERLRWVESSTSEVGPWLTVAGMIVLLLALAAVVIVSYRSAMGY